MKPLMFSDLPLVHSDSLVQRGDKEVSHVAVERRSRAARGEIVESKQSTTIKYSAGDRDDATSATRESVVRNNEQPTPRSPSVDHKAAGLPAQKR